MSANVSSSTATPMTLTGLTGHNKLANLFLIIGIIGLAIAGYNLYQGLVNADSRPLLSWLLGFGFWFSMGIGMLMMIQIWYVFGAGWPIIIRRQLEHALSAFPYLAIIVSPLILIAWYYHDNPGILWRWVNPDNLVPLPGGHTVGHDPLYLAKHSFLNLKFFTIRIILYFGILCGLSYFLRKFSFSMDKDGDTRWVSLGHNLSAIGIPLTALTLTFAAFDLFMSLSYTWFSTMYGVWFFATSMRAGICGTIVLCYFLSTRGHLKGLYKQAHRYDLGCMALTFVIFWAYVTFSQYFLIYNANIPEETFWYTFRELNADWGKNSWWYVSLAIIFGYFFIPFFYFLFYRNKILPNRILLGAVWVLTFHIIDLYFNIMPTQMPADNAVGYVVREFNVTVADIAALIGVGGICIWAMLKSMAKTAPIPIRDPYVLDSINHHQ